MYWYRSKRGSSNIIATLLIFMLMITSMGILYSQISPTILGYQSMTTSTNQEFIMQTISNEVLKLVTSSEGTQARVHIFSEQTTYDISTGSLLTVNIVDNALTAQSYSNRIGLFMAEVNGTFRPSGAPSYLNRVSDENSYLMNDSIDNPAAYVSKAKYTYQIGNFSLYFKSRISVTETTPGNFLITIIFVQITFIANPVDSSPVSFPVKQTEWTLRLRRQEAIISSDTVFTVGGPNPLSITHTFDGVAGTTYTFPAITTGSTVTVRSILIPVLFAI